MNARIAAAAVTAAAVLSACGGGDTAQPPEQPPVTEGGSSPTQIIAPPPPTPEEPTDTGDDEHSHDDERAEPGDGSAPDEVVSETPMAFWLSQLRTAEAAGTPDAMHAAYIAVNDPAGSDLPPDRRDHLTQRAKDFVIAVEQRQGQEKFPGVFPPPDPFDKTLPAQAVEFHAVNAAAGREPSHPYEALVVYSVIGYDGTKSEPQRTVAVFDEGTPAPFKFAV